MTLKHINFFDSPVMRELARQALAKGTIEPDMEAIVKKAALDKKAFQTTGNVFLDMIALASGLRDRGYVKEAGSLEAKIFAYKKASDEFSSELNSAHPDGDAEMCDASNGLGDVETLESQHRKIVEMVNKRPTGKQAGIIGAVSSVLKVVQAKDFDADFGAAKQDKKSNFVAKVNGILDYIKTDVLPMIGSVCSPLQSDFTFSQAKLMEERGEGEYSQKYAVYAKISPSNIANVMTRYSTIFGGGQPNTQFVFDKIKSLEGAALKNYCDVAGSGIYVKFFPQPQQAPQETEPTSAVDTATNILTKVVKWNPIMAPFSGATEGSKAIYHWIVNDNVAKAASAEITKIMIDDFNKVLGTGVIDMASKNFSKNIRSVLAKTITNPIYLPLKELSDQKITNEDINNKTELESISNIIGQVNAIIDLSKKSLVSSDLQTVIKDTQTLFDVGSEFNTDFNAKVINPLTKNVKDKLVDLFKSVGGVDTTNKYAIVDKTEASALAGTVLQFGRQLGKWMQEKGPNSKEFIKYKPSHDIMRAVFNALSNVKDSTPFDEIANSIVANKGERFTSYDDLKKRINIWASKVPELVGDGNVEFDSTGIPVGKKTSAVKNNIIVKAVGKDTFDDSEKPAVPTAASGGTVPHGKISSEEKNAVMHMQFALRTLANHVSENPSIFPKNGKNVVTLIQTGKGDQNATMDGAWGVNTTKALVNAQALITEWNETHRDNAVSVSVQPTQMMYKGPAAVSAADTNTSSINELIVKAYNGSVDGSVGSNQLFDNLPDTIDWSSSDQPGMQYNKPVFASDMASLGSLYDMIIKNGWMQHQYVNDEQGFKIEGFPAKTWLFLVQWFEKRAQFVYNVSVETNKQASLKARQYYNEAKRLEDQLISYFGVSGFSSKNEDSIVNIDNLRQYSRSGSIGISSGLGGGNGGNGGGNGGMNSGYGGASSRGGVDEGQEYGSPNGRNGNTLPINPVNGNINIASSWYGSLRQDSGIKWGVLNYDTFGSESASQIARILFPSRTDFLVQYFKFITVLRNAIDNAIGNWVNNPNKKNRPDETGQSSMMEWEQAWFQILDNHERQLGVKTPTKI